LWGPYASSNCPGILLMESVPGRTDRDAAAGRDLAAVSCRVGQGSRCGIEVVHEALALTASRDMPSAPGAGSRTRVLSSDEFVVELSEHADAKSIREYTSVPPPTFLVHGFFKAGVFVTDLDRAVATLKARGVVGVGETQSDPSLGLRWVLLRDNGGNFIQVLERRRP
jgi:hypothetical protein